MVMFPCLFQSSQTFFIWREIKKHLYFKYNVRCSLYHNLEFTKIRNCFYYGYIVYFEEIDKAYKYNSIIELHKEHL